MILKIPCVFVIAIIGSAIADSDYCAALKVKCQGNQAVCRYTSDKRLGPSCRNGKFEMIPQTSEFKKALVNTHNQLRNKIASGHQKGYPPAANMNKLKWNQDLANLCKLNVRQCQMEHDGCQPAKFPTAGQNLASFYKWSASKLPPVKIEDIVKMAENWYTKEVGNGDASLIKRFDVTEDNPDRMVQHFTQIVWGDTTDVGCAASAVQKKRDSENQLDVWLCCNYNTGNIVNQPVYIAGNRTTSEDDDNSDGNLLGDILDAVGGLLG